MPIEKPEDLLEEGDQVFSLPAVFYKLQEALSDPDKSFGDYGEIISHDPGLSARLLKMVNSPFFGLDSKVETISHAISIIGLDQVVSLAMATSVIYQFKGIPNTLFNMESFWRHSIATGMAARTIGQVRKDPNVERLYLCGILHDLGRLILYIKEPGLARDTLMESRDGATNLHLVEMQQMGFDHAAVGAALLRFWQLPERLVQAVGYHHDPQAAPKYQAEAGIVHTADYIVHDMSLAQTEEFSIPNLQKDTWSRIGVDPKELAPQISKMSEQFEDTVRIFL
ncbi:MAG: HDOD domain-containing protein [Nitrospina sp.]|nr:HDOD domain-containing protein [Nitrospina sp.]